MKMSYQHLAGIASLTQAILYLIGFTFLLAVLEPLMQGAQNSQEELSRLLEYKVMYQIWILLIYVLFGIVLVILILSLDEYLGYQDSFLLQMARIFGFIWTGLITASGMITNIGLDQVAAMFPRDPKAADTLWHTILVMQEGLGGGVEIVGGIWILASSWVGLSSRKLPLVLNLIGILTGLSGILTLIPGLGVFQIVFGLVQLIWFAYLGIYLLMSVRS